MSNVTKQASTRFSIVKRSKGQSAVEKASYISRSVLVSEYDRQTYRPKYIHVLLTMRLLTENGERALDIWESPVPYDGLGLADITIKAHVEKENRELLQTLSQISMEQNLPVCAMEDESAVFVKGNKAAYVGKILWINNGDICPISQKILDQVTANEQDCIVGSLSEHLGRDHDRA